MHLPKIVFRKMTLKENIELVQWAYYEDNSSCGIHEFVLEYFPALRELTSATSKEEAYQKIEEVVTNDYESYSNRIEEEVERYNALWQSINDPYFAKISEYLNIEWPEDIDIIDARVGLTPTFPRYLDERAFAITTNMNEESVIRVSAHESLHFLWMEKFKQLFPNTKRREFDSPYYPWQYSEMVTDPILNSKEINSLLHVNEESYDCYYEMQYEGTSIIEGLRQIYTSTDCIEDKIVKGYTYAVQALDANANANTNKEETSTKTR